MDSTIEAAKKTVEQAKATVDEGISATAHGLSHGAAVAGSLLAQASDGLRSVLDQGQVRKRESHSTRCGFVLVHWRKGDRFTRCA